MQVLFEHKPPLLELNQVRMCAFLSPVRRTEIVYRAEIDLQKQQYRLFFKYNYTISSAECFNLPLHASFYHSVNVTSAASRKDWQELRLDLQ